MLVAISEMQPPLLAVMLLGGCVGKAWRVARDRSIASGLGPTGLLPVRLRRPVMIVMCVVELSLGLGLIATAGAAGAGLPATATRAGTALFFLIATGMLYLVRQFRPDVGCGCFGDLSDAPVGLRTIARAGLLCLSAVIAIGAPPLRMPSTGGQAALWLGLLAAELALIAALSPELGEAGIRLGYSEPCELRRLPVARTMAALRVSAQWRRHAGQVSAQAPVDLWREGCWRFVVYPGVADGRDVDIVFAVFLQARRPPIRVAILDEATNEVMPLARESALS